jgi:hypothetical protein
MRLNKSIEGKGLRVEKSHVSPLTAISITPDLKLLAPTLQAEQF